MMDAEQKAKESFKQMETELIDKLDILINENKGDDEYLQVFNNLMLDLVQYIDPTWQDTGTVFVSSASRILERLPDYTDVLQDDKSKAMISTVKKCTVITHTNCMSFMRLIQISLRLLQHSSCMPIS